MTAQSNEVQKYITWFKVNPKQTFITFGVTQQIHTHDNPKYVPDRYMSF